MEKEREQVQLIVKHNGLCANVAIEVDTSDDRMVKLLFNNGDYCNIDAKTLCDKGWYLTTYENVYAKDAFVDQLKEGKIIIKKGE